jgi:hypothetical protein
MDFTLQFTTFRAMVWLVDDVTGKPLFELLIFGMDRSLAKRFHKLVGQMLIELLEGHTRFKLPEFIEAWIVSGCLFF